MISYISDWIVSKDKKKSQEKNENTQNVIKQDPMEEITSRSLLNNDDTYFHSCMLHILHQFHFLQPSIISNSIWNEI